MTDQLVTRLEVKFSDDGAPDTAGTFEGYGAVFGSLDSHGDVIEPGAFKRSLREWKAVKRLPPMLLQHAGWWGADDLVPIGVWDDMVEDEQGLWVRGRLLALDTDRGKSVYAAMRAGALDGLSIGYLPKEFTLGTKPDEPARRLKRIDLVEVSIVTFPANAAARVEHVKGASGWTERDVERLLREAGLSRTDAKTIVAKGCRALRREADESETVAELVASVRAGTAILQEH